MLGGDYGNPLFFDVEVESSEFGPDGREFVFEDLGVEVCAVEIDAPRIEAEHFALDGASHDVSGGEFEAWIVVVHESTTEMVAEGRSGSTKGLGEEEAFELGVREGGGMELLEFHVLDFCPYTVGEGDAIGCGDAGVGGGVVDFSGSAGGEHGCPGGEVSDSSIGELCRCAHATTFVEEKLGDEGVFKDGDVWVLADGRADGAFDFPAGFVGVMDDAMARVATFSSQVEFVAGGEIEARAVLLEPIDGARGVLD